MESVPEFLLCWALTPDKAPRLQLDIMPNLGIELLLPYQKHHSSVTQNADRSLGLNHPTAC